MNNKMFYPYPTHKTSKCPKCGASGKKVICHHVADPQRRDLMECKKCGYEWEWI
jgi:transcription elongation factor Elf1